MWHEVDAYCAIDSQWTDRGVGQQKWEQEGKELRRQLSMVTTQAVNKHVREHQ
jgi:hypothetical protein